MPDHNRRVLVVDDDKALADSLVDILDLKGWEASAVYHGEGAVERIRDDPPDAVVMDIRMPGIGGVGALRRIQALDSSVKVMLMTAYAAAEVVDEARREGALEIFAKPVSPDLLLARLRSIFEERRPVLLVDGDPEFLATLCDVLERERIPVLPAGGLAQALEHLEASDPSVVVLDLGLDPQVEPADCMVAIKEASPQVIFVLYSGHRSVLDEARERVPAEWVHGCLYKPFSPDDLIEILS